MIACERCDREAMGGGRWCLRHFRAYVAAHGVGPGRSHTHLQPCGTPAAYRRHLRRGEEPCGGCRDAHARANYHRAAAA